MSTHITIFDMCYLTSRIKIRIMIVFIHIQFTVNDSHKLTANWNIARVNHCHHLISPWPDKVENDTDVGENVAPDI